MGSSASHKLIKEGIVERPDEFKDLKFYTGSQVAHVCVDNADFDLVAFERKPHEGISIYHQHIIHVFENPSGILLSLSIRRPLPSDSFPLAACMINIGRTMKRPSMLI